MYVSIGTVLANAKNMPCKNHANMICQTIAQDWVNLTQSEGKRKRLCVYNAMDGRADGNNGRGEDQQPNSEPDKPNRQMAAC